MVGTIIPKVLGDRAQGRRSMAGFVFTCSCLIGACSLGLVLAMTGQLLLIMQIRWTHHVAYLLGGLALLFSLRELKIVRVPAPIVRQVPRRWLAYGYGVAIPLYGVALGFALTTRASLTLYMAGVLTIGVLTIPGFPLVVAALAGIFGIARGIGVWATLGQSESADAVFRRMQELEHRKVWVDAFSGWALAFTGGVLLGAA